MLGIAALACASSAWAGACSSDDGGGTAGGGGAAAGGSGGSGGKVDGGPDSATGGSPDTGAEAASCSDGVKNGAETDVDCGGGCPACAAGKTCSQPSDCTDSVCQSGACQAGSCTDGVKNAGETGVDCGGPCPVKYHGEGCVNGTNGSKVCSSMAGPDAGTDEAGTPKFTVTISWNATGGNGKVNYTLAYAPGNQVFNSLGIAGGGAQNVCTSGPVTQTFDLPMGDQYTYKVWWADCIKSNACSGCGSDTVIAEGGPFGIAPDACN